MRLPKVEIRSLFWQGKVRFTNTAAVLLLALTCLCVASRSALAQGAIDNNLADAGAQPGRMASGPVTAPAAFSGTERPDTASFLMSEPILNLPGRGLNLGLNLNYDSSLYQKDYDGGDLTVLSTRQGPTHDSVKGYPAYGFTLGFGLLIRHNTVIKDCTYSQTDPTISCPGPAPPSPGPTYRSGTITFIDNTGARHRMINGFSTDLSELRYKVEGETPTITYPDGMKVIFGSKRLQQTGSTRKTYFCPDNGQGTQNCKIYDEYFSPTKIVDRNGNYIEISYVETSGEFFYNSGGPRIAKIVDTLGRETIFNYDPTYFSLASITVPGFEPGTRREVARFIYGGNLTRDHYFLNQQTYSEPHIKQLKYVYFPGTKTGVKYSWSSYCQVYKVERVAGMEYDADTNTVTVEGQVTASTEYNYPVTRANLDFQLPSYTKRTDYWMNTNGSMVGPVVHQFSVDYTSEYRTSITTTTTPDGTVVEVRKRYYPAQDPASETADKWDDGLVLEEKITKAGKLYSKVNYHWGSANRIPLLLDQTVTNDAEQLKKTEFTYYGSADSGFTGVYTNIKEVKEYGFDGAEIKRTEITYETGVEWKNRWLVKLPKSITIYEGGATAPSSIVEYTYDGNTYLTPYSDVLMYDEGTPLQRGNVTSVTTYTNAAAPAQGVTITSAMSYDIAGNMVQSVDPKGNISTVAFSLEYHYAYPVRTTTPKPDASGVYASSVELVTETTYNFNTGLVTTTKDVNSQAITYEYDDPIERLTRVNEPDGGWTAYEYGDSAGNFYLKTVKALTNSSSVASYQYFDGLGRKTRVFSYDGSSAAKTWVAADTEYDTMGRVVRVSNPYFVSTLGGTIAAASINWTTRTYDPLGRVRTVTTDDGAQVKTDYDGSRALMTDAAGKKRLMDSNALGQLTDVWEIKPSDSATESVPAFPTLPAGTAGYHTSYAYDIRGNLRKVQQGAQRRYYAYDSMSRLIRVKLPEQGTHANFNLDTSLVSSLSDSNNAWSLSLEYENNNNLKSRTDARGVKATYSYDALNRVTKCNYSLINAAPSNYTAAPNIEYFYDGLGLPTGVVAPNAQGRLTSIRSSVSETQYTAFDELGRITQHQQVTGGQPPYSMGYTYDLAGNMTTQTYPSGRIVNTEYDPAGRISRISGPSAPGLTDTRVYASQFVYAAHMAVSSVKIGTVWQHTTFDPKRLQPTQIGVGASATDSSQLRLDYTYGTTDNNGNLRTQTITIPDLTQAMVQTYTYDDLNRLQSAEEAVGGARQWIQTFKYDPYGNRSLDTSVVNNVHRTTPALVGLNPKITEATNLIEPRADTTEQYAYDKAGNLTKDRDGNQFSYDGENRQVSYTLKGVTAPAAKYSYDGDGRRVKKVVGNETTIFVYNALSQLVAEYSTVSPTTSGTSYIFTDTLGTPRMVINNGVVTRHDYLPFGDEIMVYSGRATAQSYQGDLLRQKFTGYERDYETGLDYAQARYFSKDLGRFNSVDPSLGSGKPDDPQSWNRYTYALNNPLRYIDPDGLDPFTPVWVKNVVTGRYRVYLTQEAYDEFLESVTVDSDWVPAMPGERLHLGYLSANSDLEWYRRNVHLEGKDVYIGEDGNFHEIPINPSLYNEEFLPAMKGYATAIKPWVKAAFYVDLFLVSGLSTLGPVGGATLGLESQAAGQTMAVIGRVVYTNGYQGMKGVETLNMAKSAWSLARNDLWVKSVIRRRLTVLISTPEAEIAGTITAREIAQFLEAGYTRFGNYLVPPP